jgi:hypothetical protein
MIHDDLRSMERSTFRAVADTGLADIFLASVFAVFAVAPLLSARLGDFWSTAVFVPVWACVYMLIRGIHARVVVPRVGIIEVAPPRRARLRRFTLVMLAMNVAALALGVYAANQPTAQQDSIPTVLFPMILLVWFSLIAYFLEIPRAFFYGVLLAAASVGGEMLFRRGYASHHGFPIAFGAAAGIIFVSGLVRFWRVVPRRIAGSEEPLQEHGDE